MAQRGFLRFGPNGIGLQSGVWDASYPTTRGPDKSLWAGSPTAVDNFDPLPVFSFADDFFGIVTGAQNWISTQATSGTANAGTLSGGTVALNSGATTLHQGIQIQKAGGHFACAANKSIWYECSFQINRLQGEFLWGLFDIDTTLVATGSLHATDGIGFKSLTSDGVVLPVCGASSTYTTGSSVVTLTTGTNVQLGFVVSSNTSVTYYVNGVQVGSAVTTNIPTAQLTPSFVCQAGSGAGGNVQMDVDFVQVTQLR